MCAHCIQGSARGLGAKYPGKQTNEKCILLGNVAIQHRDSFATSAPSSPTRELGSLTVRRNFSPSCARAKWISWNTNQINAQKGG